MPFGLKALTSIDGEDQTGKTYEQVHAKMASSSASEPRPVLTWKPKEVSIPMQMDTVLELTLTYDAQPDSITKYKPHISHRQPIRDSYRWA